MLFVIVIIIIIIIIIILYCSNRWPAILTTDPSYGEYYDTLMNKENEVTHYHVEFLGEPHSHAWVVQSGVHPFASVSDEDKIPRFRKLHGKRLTDLKKSFQLALFEAVTLQKMEDSERLSGCHFHLKELTPNGEGDVLNLKTLNVTSYSANTTYVGRA